MCRKICSWDTCPMVTCGLPDWSFAAPCSPSQGQLLKGLREELCAAANGGSGEPELVTAGQQEQVAQVWCDTGGCAMKGTYDISYDHALTRGTGWHWAVCPLAATGPQPAQSSLCLLVLPSRMGAPDGPAVGLWQLRAVLWVLPRLKCRVRL